MQVAATDFYRMLSEAIEGLDDRTRDARRAVYDRARAAFRDEARARSLPLNELAEQQRALERAILDIEISALLGEPLPHDAPEMRAKGSRVVETAPAPPTAAKVERDVRDWAPPAPRAEPERTQTISWSTDPVIEKGPPSAASVRPVVVTAPPRKRRRYPLVIFLPAVTAVAIAGFTLYTLVIERDGIAALRGENPLPPPPVASQPAAPVQTAVPQPVPESTPSIRDLVELGDEFLARGELERAIAAYEFAQRQGTPPAGLYANRAFAHWRKGDIERAITDFSEALAREPDHHFSLVGRAVALNARGDHSSAIRDLDRAISINPTDPDAWNSRCWARALLGQLKEAVADCTESLRLRPNDANTLDSRGFAHLKAGQLDRAIADYNAALKLDAKLPGSLYGRGLAKIARGDRGGGQIDIKAALAIRPDIQEAFARYGVK